MCSLNLIVMKANSREQMLWIVRCITDSLENDLTEHGVQDFTTRCLKGTSGSSGFIALSICKLEMLNHFLTNVGSKLARDEFRQMLGSMIDHPTFRSWCGSPKESADLSWQGQLLDSEVKAVNFFKCIFNGTLDSHLKQILKGSGQIDDVMANEKLLSMTNEILGAIDDEAHGPGGKPVVKDTEGEDEHRMPTLEDLVGDAEILAESNADLQAHLTVVKEYIARFVTFVTSSGESVTKTTEVLKGTLLPKFPVRSEKHWCIWYDSKSAGESSAQPNCRVPAFQAKLAKCNVQASLQAHEQEDLGDQCLVFMLDGFRSLDTQMGKCIVSPDGAALPKTKTTYQVCYCEKHSEPASPCTVAKFPRWRACMSSAGKD